MARVTHRTRNVPLAARLGIYLVIDAIVLAGLTLWNGDSWLTELKRGIFPAIMIAVFSELTIRDAKRRQRARQS